MTTATPTISPTLHLLARLALAALLMFASTTASLHAQRGQRGQREVSRFFLEDGVALGGFDPVSYFAEGSNEPVRGKKAISITHEGVTYRFVNKEHREYFEANPSRYEPVFGGWCAWAMAFGKRRLVSNGAGLILRARRLNLLAEPYVALTTRRIAARLGMPRADLETVSQTLADRMPDEEPLLNRANTLRNARKPKEILRAAGALKELERKLER